MHVLVAIPFEPQRAAIWQETAVTLATRLPGANPGVTFKFVMRSCPRTEEPGDGRFSPHARARNGFLVNLEEYTHIMWVDSDLTFYPPNLPTKLLEVDRDGIVAPAVILERLNLFYDTMGFVKDGVHARQTWPWFKDIASEGAQVSLDSVGCIYIAPARLYRDLGAEYRDTPGFTEHYSVCQMAKAYGMRVTMDLTLQAVHAYLPDHGEQFH